MVGESDVARPPKKGKLLSFEYLPSRPWNRSSFLLKVRPIRLTAVATPQALSIHAPALVRLPLKSTTHALKTRTSHPPQSALAYEHTTKSID